MCRVSLNMGASTSWNPQGLSRPVMGLLYLYLCAKLSLQSIVCRYTYTNKLILWLKLHFIRLVDQFRKIYRHYRYNFLVTDIKYLVSLKFPCYGRFCYTSSGNCRTGPRNHRNHLEECMWHFAEFTLLLSNKFAIKNRYGKYFSAVNKTKVKGKLTPLQARFGPEVG
jgi:hypothetical protein